MSRVVSRQRISQTPKVTTGNPIKDGIDPEIIVFQTSDPYNYYDILVETSRTARSYCQRNGFVYESYIGIKRGYFGWHAAFNRIPVLEGLIESDFKGWFFYLDADAYIADQDFDLKSYLEDKRRYAAIFVASGATDLWFDVNDGVFLLNTSSIIAQDLVRLWAAEFAKLTDAMLRTASAWGDVPHDQDLLQLVLRNNPGFKKHIYFESETLLNSNEARFVRQFLRAGARDINERRLTIKQHIDTLLGAYESSDHVSDVTTREATIIISGLYRALLGRSVDHVGLDQYASLLKNLGLEYGFQKVVDELVKSDEFKVRYSPDADRINHYQASLVAGALYRALFGREPDLHCQNAIPPLLLHHGLEKGLQKIIEDIMRSDEFRTRMRIPAE